jgi:hypothetical protein
MWHPITLLPSVLFWFFLAATLIVMVAFQILDRPLRTSAAPNGIVSFELAGSVEKARAMIESWDEQARLYTAVGLGLDYLFMLLYATTIAIACSWSAEVYATAGWPLASWGGLLAWGVWLAAVLDGVENYSLWRLLKGPVVNPWPGIARWCACIKFALIAIGILYGLVGGIVYLLA